jgi:selenide, water dikinase
LKIGGTLSDNTSTQTSVRLTSFSHGAGCACKLRPADLAQVLRKLPRFDSPDLLVGFDTSDDAAVMRIGNGNVLVQTVDFFTPVVDEPYDFGRIAAANALSDIYAMGGQPLLALNIVGFPMTELGPDVLGDILRGGSDVAREAGCLIAGGHSIDDKEPKYGMVVSAVMRESDVITNAATTPGDRLVLTKPLGSGVLTTAIKRGLASQAQRDRVVEVMSTLNRAGAEAAREANAHGMTDVTGFGLLGHMAEMLRAGGTSAVVNAGAVPVLDGVARFVEGDVYPGGSKANMAFVGPEVDWAPDVSPVVQRILCDAQTSGGLLIAVAPDRVDELVAGLQARRTLAASIIGTVTERKGALIHVEP